MCLEGLFPVHVHMQSFMRDVLVSQPGSAGAVLVTVRVRRVTERSVFLSCTLQRGKMPKHYKIPCQGDVGG